MKKIIISGLLVIVLFFISQGCQQQVVCNEPYILVGTECCLDSNDNSICDKDEPTKETEEPPTVDYRPVQAITVEFCDMPRKFDCIEGYAIKEKIILKFKNEDYRAYGIKKIALPSVNCEITFDKYSLDEAIRYGEVRLIEIPCIPDKEVVESMFYMELEMYTPMSSVVNNEWVYSKTDFKEESEEIKNWGGYFISVVR